MESIFIIKELSTGKYLSLNRDGLHLNIDVEEAQPYYSKQAAKDTLENTLSNTCSELQASNYVRIPPKNCYIFQIIKVYQVVIK